jgi:hypothetical protein
MSGDLEDFLRRAAQRRQAKASQRPQPPAPRPKPQYSNRDTERVVDAVIVEEPLVAEVIAEDSNPLAAQQRRLQESRKAAALAQAEAAKKLSNIKGRRPSRLGSRARGGPASLALSGVTSEDLIRLLSSPQGIRQAILLREILDRPEHRW